MIDVIKVISGFTPQRCLRVNTFKLVNCLVGFCGITPRLSRDPACKSLLE